MYKQSVNHISLKIGCGCKVIHCAGRISIPYQLHQGEQVTGTNISYMECSQVTVLFKRSVMLSWKVAYKLRASWETGLPRPVWWLLFIKSTPTVCTTYTHSTYCELYLTHKHEEPMQACDDCWTLFVILLSATYPYTHPFLPQVLWHHSDTQCTQKDDKQCSFPQDPGAHEKIATQQQMQPLLTIQRLMKVCSHRETSRNSDM